MLDDLEPYPASFKFDIKFLQSNLVDTLRVRKQGGTKCRRGPVGVKKKDLPPLQKQVLQREKKEIIRARS